MKVVAFGGGHGLYASLTALRSLPVDLTAVVTVADDGGSSGRLRQEFGVLPPGDLRQALVALASEHDPTMPALFQRRFAGDGPLAGHALGNLIVTALTDELGSPVRALDYAGSLLGVRGRVLPMALGPLAIEADVEGLGETTTIVRGQVAIATTPGQVRRVRLVPPDPRPCTESLDAVREADWLIFGPGSWFTSVLPHFLVPELFAAIHDSSARRAVILNVGLDRETEGFPIEAHLDAFSAHAPGVPIDIVLADARIVRDHRRLAGAAQSLGGRLVVAPVAVADNSPRHDPVALADALRTLLGVVSAKSDQPSGFVVY